MLVNFGSSCSIQNELVTGLARSLKTVLDTADSHSTSGSKLQALWKLPRIRRIVISKARLEDTAFSATKSALQGVWIIKWVDAEPISVL